MTLGKYPEPHLCGGLPLEFDAELKMQTPHKDEQCEALKRVKNYTTRLLVAAFCIAAVFFVMHSRYFNLTTTNDSLWDEIKDFVGVGLPCILSSFAFIYLLPVLVRGRGQQWLKAVVLAALAVYFAFQYWEMIIENYGING